MNGQMAIVNIPYATTVQALPAHEGRRSIVLSTQYANSNVFISFSPTVTKLTGVIIPTNARPIKITYDDIGALIEQPIYAMQDGGPTIVCNLIILEGFV